MDKTKNFEEILNMDPRSMLEWILQEFSGEVPEEDIPKMILTAEDMKSAGTVMLKLTGFYSYLTTLHSYAKIRTREAKRDKTNKEAAEDMVDKKEIIHSFAESVKQSYSAISRAVTIYIENSNELKMGRGL